MIKLADILGIVISRLLRFLAISFNSLLTFSSKLSNQFFCCLLYRRLVDEDLGGWDIGFLSVIFWQVAIALEGAILVTATVNGDLSSSHTFLLLNELASSYVYIELLSLIYNLTVKERKLT